MEFKHIPVMLEPCMELLGLDRHPNGVFVDGTLGGGGHTQEILSRTRGKVLGHRPGLGGAEGGGGAPCAFWRPLCSASRKLCEHRFAFARSGL